MAEFNVHFAALQGRMEFWEIPGVRESLPPLVTVKVAAVALVEWTSTDIGIALMT